MGMMLEVIVETQSFMNGQTLQLEVDLDNVMTAGEQICRGSKLLKCNGLISVDRTSRASVDAGNLMSDQSDIIRLCTCFAHQA